MLGDLHACRHKASAVGTVDGMLDISRLSTVSRNLSGRGGDGGR